MQSPELELFNYLYKFSSDKGYSTYDYLPMEDENAEYPFVIIGNSQTVNDSTKFSLNGSIDQTIEFWNDAKDRANVSEMIDSFLKEALKIRRTNHYNLALEINRTEQRLVIDTSVENQILLHGILDLHFKIL
ncbi:hypothetical protein [Lactobacillus terrae]|uniref:hypothetical protein n=1 Tax=Lactobacillus terrae TaxID=2269374 RepID=UPI000C1B7510|nr:hypothetical protein [Lactobacillus terrae]